MDQRSTTFVGLQVLLLFTGAALVFSLPEPKLFLSIDCGSDSNYNDTTGLGIEWEDDAKYISTGSNAYITANIWDTNVNDKQSGTLRYFDEGRNRDCYVLPVKPQYTYLLRATFFYGNWRPPGDSPWPSTFSVYLNATLWIPIDSEYASSQDSRTGNPPETIIYSTGSSLSVCLVGTPAGGFPYINALELRELSQGMYTETAWNGNSSQASFLRLSIRGNPGVGIQDSAPYIRFPDDIYDRIWQGLTPHADNNSTIKQNNTILSTSDHEAENQPPFKVMADAWFYNVNEVTTAEFIASPSPIIIYAYFQELDPNDYSPSNVRGMELSLNDQPPIVFNVSDQPLQVNFFGYLHRALNSVTLMKSSWSKLSPILNAFEIYFVYDWNSSTTAPEDVKAVLGLQRRYNLTDWGGDPCVPVPYEWLSCSNNSGTPSSLRVTGLILASKSMVEIPPEVTNLTALTLLNLSYNRLATFPTELKELNNLTVLDLSNNLLGGSIADFWATIITDFGSLLEINASNNRFQNEGQFQISSLKNLVHTNVKYVSLDNLNISGTLDVSGWFNTIQDGATKTVVQGGTPSQLVLSFIDNNITNIYPSLDSVTKDIRTIIYSTNQSYVNSGNAILLGGNPFCKPNSISLAHDYFCRFSNDAFPLEGSNSQSRGVNEVAIVIGSTLGAFAVVVVLVSAIYFAAAWKLRKKSYALCEIQEALSKQKVQPPFFSYTDLREATSNFSSDNKLGEGGFGAVYKGVMADGTRLAIKKLFPPKHANQAKRVFSDFLNEVVLITGIRHKNLLQLKGCCVKEDQRFLVYEYAENGNVAEALWEQSSQHGRVQLDWQKRLDICVGVARGLSYLHEALQPRIIHRDIKAANILLNKNLDAKIGDFGLALPFFDEQSRADFTRTAGTMGYVAPEYVTQGELTEKADVYSFGVLVLEIVCGRKCIDSTLPSEQIFLLNLTRLLSSKGRMLDLLEPAIRASVSEIEATRVLNISQLCIQMDSTRRPAMSHVLTMLSGSIDVIATPQDIPVYYQSDQPESDNVIREYRYGSNSPTHSSEESAGV